MSITLGFLIIFWVLSANYKVKFQYIKTNPAATVSVALFTLYMIGTIYSSAHWNMRLDFLMKYHKLLLIPIIISVLDSDKYRKYAMNTFLMGMILVLTISYMKWLGVVPFTDVGQGFIVFKARIAQNLFMSFAMFMMMHRALKSTGSIKLTWVILSIMAGLNILFLVNGRSGQITMFALLTWLIYETWGIKSLSYWLSFLLLAIALNQTAPSFLHSRLFEISSEINSQQLTGEPTSSGIRIEMYTNTMLLIKQHPLIGGGTGSLKNEYEEFARNKPLVMKSISNPHNQFLLTTQELGILGLMILILMWSLHWKASYQTPPDDTGTLLRGLIITIAIGSLFNSLLLDASEGNFYCVLAGVLLSAYKPKKT